jgi:drug/metabolite transporter (DMT)-like permease
MNKIFLIVLVGLLVVFWGNAFVAIKYLLEAGGLSPMGLTALRYLPAAAVSLALLLLLYPLPVIMSAWRREWAGIGLYGLAGVLGYNIALNFGEVRIAAGTASLIVGLSPVLTLLAARVFLGERLTNRKFWGIVTAFAGLFVVVRWGTGEPVNFDYLLAILITLGAPLSWVVYTIVGKPLVDRSDATLVTLSAIVWGSLPLVFFIPHGLGRIAPKAWLALGFLALICTVFGFLVWSWALKRTEASRLGAVVYLIPLVTISSSLILLGQPPTWGLTFGGLVLMGGVALAEL